MTRRQASGRTATSLPWFLRLRARVPGVGAGAVGMRWVWYGSCFPWLCGCLPFILPFEYQAVNAPPTIVDARPALDDDLSGEITFGADPVSFFIVVSDKNDLDQVSFRWDVSAPGGGGDIIDNSVEIPDSNGQFLTSQVLLLPSDVAGYSGGEIRCTITDSFGENTQARWGLTTEGTIK